MSQFAFLQREWSAAFLNQLFPLIYLSDVS